MRRMAGYPKGFYLLLLFTFLALVASGVLLLPNMLIMRMDWDIPLEISGDLRLASAASHCIAAFLFAMLFGSLAILHIRSGWRRRQNRFSGILMVLLFVVLTMTAVGIYYFGDVELSLWSSVIHSCAAIVLVAITLWHGIVGHLLHNQRLHGS